MKEYRIIRTRPSTAIVNVGIDDNTWVGYTHFDAARRDMMKLKATYPEMDFEIVEYVLLHIPRQESNGRNR